MQASLIRLKVQEREGFDRRGEAIRIGVPLRRGAVFDSRSLVLRDGSEEQLPLQCRPLARWIDGSIKWLLLDAVLNVSARGESDLALQISADQPPHHSPLTCRATTGQIEIDTGSARFTLPSQGSGLLSAFNDAGSLFVDARDTCVRVTGVQNAQWQVELGLPQIEDQGSVRVTVLREGRAFSPGAAQLRLKLRFTFLVNTSAVQLDVEAWNPRAAIHPGGMWDLGDPNSIHFRDLSIDLAPAHPGPASRWRSEPFLEEKSANTPLVIHQNSSGGENWNSSNHVDASGNLTVTFAGYRVTDADGTVLESGKRASPYLAVQSPAGTTSVGVQQFWQNFPKSLRWSGQKLSIGLFPEESSQTFELQPGEKKRHSVMLDFTRRGEPSRLRQLQQPVAVSLDPEAVAATAAVGYLVPQSQDPNAAYLAYLDTILDGQHSFLAKRELIDEFGWRNFGDLYADHEAVHHKDSKPFISHYNNQYDFIYGAGFHFLRSGDVRWFQLMRDAARHVVDIDIYHTDGDKTGFSGGLFWHTDHYKDAFTCTHRTYSKHNAEGSYGGGPSNEHNYTSGLLLYHWLTGDPEARAAVCELAEWVIAMDDGSRTLFGLIDEGPTGLASKSRDADFHKPGRGAGNSINALLDAHAVTGSRRFMQKAEELIQRVIHPADEVDRLELDQPETRWSYIVFLQVLGKYLDRKLELGERDYMFWYSRAALLQYARWMLRNEVPYKDVLHKVELPTETWPAHDIRKCHALHIATRYAEPTERAAFAKRALYFFERCLGDLMSFETAYVTRPQVILCVYGGIHAYFQAGARDLELGSPPAYDFGAPPPFTTQRARLASSVRRKLSVIGNDIGRIASERLHYLRRRLRR